MLGRETLLPLLELSRRDFVEFPEGADAAKWGATYRSSIGCFAAERVVSPINWGLIKYFQMLA